MEEIRSSIERGVASLRIYLSSVEIREDTKLALLLGALAGLAIVAAIAAYPGKPIDYTGVGIDLPPGMRGTEAADATGKSKKVDGEGPAAATADGRRAAGLQQIQGVVDNLSELRRRKAAGNRSTPLLAPATGEESLANCNTEGGEKKAEGEWDANRLDEDKIARKIGSSKAARMLGLTEDQVRQAVVDAKQELQQSNSTSGGSTGRDSSGEGMGLSGLLSLVMLVALLGGLWAYLSVFPHGTLSRFLIGAFPREMETLGLTPQ